MKVQWQVKKGRFRVALAYLKPEEHVLPQITPDGASQEWCADFRCGLITSARPSEPDYFAIRALDDSISQRCFDEQLRPAGHRHSEAGLAASGQHEIGAHYRMPEQKSSTRRKGG